MSARSRPCPASLPADRLVVSMSALCPVICRDLVKSYGDHLVLSGVDLIANPGHPLGVVGENGVGKSTLLRLLSGEETGDSGEVSRPADIGYLPQDPAFKPPATVASVLEHALAPLHNAVRRLEQLAFHLDEPGAAADYAETLAWAEHHDAWEAERRSVQALQRLSLRDISPERKVARMSGGERSRLALAALITRRPDCLILDEPTNHLDDEAMAFVENFLSTVPGVVIVASHDRVLLHDVCKVIVDLDDTHFGMDGEGGNRFVGNFSTYLGHKQAARRRWEQAFADQQDELADLRRKANTTAREVAHNRSPKDRDKYIYNFKGGNVQATIRRRVRDAEQRIDALERNRIVKPPAPLTFDHSLTGDSRGGQISLREVVVDSRLRLHQLDVFAGEHLLVSGANGSGKSTLLALMAGRVTVDSGAVEISARRIGLLPQDVHYAQPERTPNQLFADLTGLPGQLADLGLLHPRELSRPIGVLSTGQQRRLALAVLVARRPDLLLLDEPTNHISLALASELEAALQRSRGTTVVASHDRWLRQHWSGPTVTLDGNR